ncbi:MAG: cell division protein FtsZ [Verrucomicrobiota bacterium]
MPLAGKILADSTMAIEVIGIGGAGTNVVDRLKMENLDRLHLAAMDTDHQALSASPLQEKILLGAEVTHGLSAGSDPAAGREAAEADEEKIAAAVKGCDLVFLVAGLGGGTGGGAAPVVARLAAQTGALVIVFCPLPFSFEGGRRLKQADEALRMLRPVCDAVIPLPNDTLLQAAGVGENALSSFARGDEWIGRAIKAVWAMLFRTGLINVDFATLQSAFPARGGKTLFGLGSGAGVNPAAAALESLRLCPLLATAESARKVDRLLVHITGGADLTLDRVNEIMTALTAQFGRDAHIIMGAVIDEALPGRVEIVVLGTSELGATSRRPLSAQRPRAPSAPAVAGTPPPSAIVTPDRKGTKAKTAQDEFAFGGPAESRGYFDKTERNLFEGQDLDVPTYQRQGVKIVL